MIYQLKIWILFFSFIGFLISNCKAVEIDFIDCSSLLSSSHKYDNELEQASFLSSLEEVLISTTFASNNFTSVRMLSLSNNHLTDIVFEKLTNKLLI